MNQKTNVKGGTNMSLTINGVDISYCQRGLGYEKLKANGIKFAIIRASYTGTDSHKQGTDSLLNRHVNGCIAQGIDYGFYHYSCAKSVEEAKREAQYIVNQIKKYPLPKYPVFFDAEESQISAQGKTIATDIALAFIEEVESLGYPSGLYTNPYWMERYLEKSRLIDKIDIWLAHWVEQSNYKYGQKMWQNGLITIDGHKVDSDFCFVDYPALTAEWYKKHNINPEPTPAPETTEYKIGDIVNFKGGFHYASANSLIPVGGKRSQGKAKITVIAATAKHKYHLIGEKGGSNVYGWVDEKNIEKITENEEKKESPVLKVGDKVMIKSGARTYNGKRLASFVYSRPHTISEIYKDRAVVTYGKVVVAAVNVKDLLLV